MAANIKVVDASFVLAFLLPDEYNKDVDHYFQQFSNNFIHFVASSLLPFEVSNSLKVALLRKRITKNYALERLEEFLAYGIELVEPDFKQTFLLAEKNALTIYDASYVYLAKKETLPLLTLDKKLQNIALTNF